ncbi:MAG: hypothetical protein R3E97_16380 [Candidatus Eisenbacteria bacterium]
MRSEKDDEMTNGPLDPRIDMMVAALYGELTDDELRRFDALLAEDPALRSEWDELRGTRTALASWEIEETPPSFVLMEPSSGPRRTRASGSRTARASESWGERLRGLVTNRGQLGWAVAAAACFLLVLSWSGFRVQWEGNGVAFRFGDTPSVEERIGSGPEGAPDAGGADLAQFATDSLGTHIPLTGRFGTASNESPYLTRDEFQAYTQGVALAFGDLLHAAEYNRVKNEQFSGYMRSLYEGLEDRQAESYLDLRGRIETIRYDMDRPGDGSYLNDLPQGESISPGAKRNAAPRENEVREEGR